MLYRGRNLMEAVRLLGALYPNAVYIPPSGSGGPCHYDIGVVKDGPLVQGCIIGQAFRMCGLSQYCKMIGYDASEDTRRFIVKQYGWEHLVHTEQLPPLVRWCQLVQDYQDFGYSWGDCITNADNCCDFIS